MEGERSPEPNTGIHKLPVVDAGKNMIEEAEYQAELEASRDNDQFDSRVNNSRRMPGNGPIIASNMRRVVGQK
jgi:hypothetical protein